MKEKILKIWDENKDKIQKIGDFMLTHIGLIECLLLWVIAFLFAKDTGSTIILYAIAGFSTWRNIKCLFKVFKSKNMIRYDAVNYRVQGFQGPQGAGKTSLMLYNASVLKNEVYSNVPFEINGKLSYVLDSDVLTMRKKVKENATVLMDEITIYFNNTDKSEEVQKTVDGFEIFLQLCRHFFDGTVLTASVNMGRIMQKLEEKFGVFKQLLGQETLIDSFILAPIIKLIAKSFFHKELHLGVRVWRYLKMSTITKENYMVDIGTAQESKNDKSSFSGVYEIYAYNNNLKYRYNDRFMKPIYDQIPQTQLQTFSNLEFDMKQLKNTGFQKVINYFSELFKKENKK